VIVQNIASYFEGREACLICYAVIDAVSHAIPKAKCINCGKKFHPNCIYKWFKQAHNHMCPHCSKSFF
jgi:DNA-directed RNA polymerase subunit RPC12/RpoP